MGSNGTEIKLLSDDSVRRIVAEQAITDLSSIVKELVDNALDAESTTIKSKWFHATNRLTVAYIFTIAILMRAYYTSVPKFDCLVRDWTLSKFRTMALESHQNLVRAGCSNRAHRAASCYGLHGRD